jgi:hypothetical protein
VTDRAGSPSPEAALPPTAVARPATIKDLQTMFDGVDPLEIHDVLRGAPRGTVEILTTEN